MGSREDFIMWLHSRQKALLKTVGIFLGTMLISTFSIVNHVQADVLWDQPISEVNTGAYIDQVFPDYPTYTSFIADDFVNNITWNISKIFVPGSGWNGFSSLLSATSLNFAIYSDLSGIPSGTPPTGWQWNISLDPSDAQIALDYGTDGFLSNVTLNLTTALNLSAGHWWLLFWPDMSFSSSGEYGRQASDTTNGYTAQFINPGGGFGYGSDWQDWNIIGMQQTDVAFRLEGTLGENNNVVPEPSTALLIGMGLLAGAALARRRERKTEM